MEKQRDWNFPLINMEMLKGKEEGATMDKIKDAHQNVLQIQSHVARISVELMAEMFYEDHDSYLSAVNSEPN